MTDKRKLKKVGNIIRKERKKRDLSQQELGEMIGGDKFVILGLEKGRRELKLKEGRILADLFDIDISKLEVK